MHAPTGFQRDALSSIAGIDAPTGLAITARLDDDSPRPINHGRRYPNLDTLVDVGLVETGRIDDRTNSYSITEEGRDLLVDRRGWEGEPTGASS